MVNCGTVNKEEECKKPSYGKENCYSGVKYSYIRENGKGEVYYKSVRDHHDP